MADHVLPTLYAVLLWWSSTALVMFLGALPPRTFRWTMLAASGLLLVSVAGLVVTARDTSTAGAYAAFTFGLLAWAWQEVSFYTGYVTGPRRRACAKGCRGWRHFGHALQVSLYHELAIVASAAMITAATWGQPNRIGLWTFLLLWVMHTSARLNVFLGVRNVGEELLPEHMAFLRGFLTRKPMNPLFPLSIAVSTGAAGLLVHHAVAAGAGPFQAVGFTLLATLMVLAILEHWVLVLPLPSTALWTWILRWRRKRACATASA